MRLVTSLGFAAATLVLVAAKANPARADYLVTATSQSYISADGAIFRRGYNDTAGGPGYTVSGGCPVYTGTTCTPSGSGTTDAAPNDTAASERTGITYHEAFEPVTMTGPYDASASSFATASLASGSVGVSAQGTYLDRRFPSSGQDGGSGLADARDSDTLHFAVAGGDSSTVTLIGVTFTIHGLMTDIGIGDSQGSVLGTLGLGSAQFNASIATGGQTGHVPTVSLGQISGWVSESVSPATPGLIQFNGTYALSGASSTLGVFERLYANCDLGTSCLYDHTANLAFDLPSNVSFTSDSGVFLTEAETTSVPEPGSIALMAVGVGALGSLRRRKQARHPHTA